MRIIGAGFGRTGTMSLRAALEELGYAPCYHMLEVFKHPSHIKVWQAAADGEPVDWHRFLGTYMAGLDYPLPAFYRELLAVFPEARVILTVRDPDGWYASTKETIYQGTAVPDFLLKLLPRFNGMKKMVQATTWDRLFDGRFEDRDFAIRRFEEHIAEVKRTIPAERLLIFRVRDGWPPLCAFLEKPVPERPFPHINDRKTTRRMYLLARLVGGGGLVAATMVILYLLLRNILFA